MRKRSRYRPRVLDTDPVGIAITKAAALTPAERETLQAPVRRALNAFRSGAGDWPAWCDLADAFNISEALARAGIARDHLQTALTAQAALADLYHRQDAEKDWSLRGTELHDLDEAVWLYETQLRFVSKGEIEKALLLVQRRVKAALAGNYPAVRRNPESK